MFQQLDIMGHCIEIVLSYCFKLRCRREMKHHLLWHQNVELERTNILEERLKEKLAWKAFFPFFFFYLPLLLRGRKIKSVTNRYKRIYNTCLWCPLSLNFQMTTLTFCVSSDSQIYCLNLTSIIRKHCFSCIIPIFSQWFLSISFLLFY